ncbi:hypothetical protein AXF42_Ash004995 [Apostasia shenzhenica]|uniref:WPP domain-associated protein n=1 Tax=Apostasia shenzhenica TaxID=1088818 RepID=A0A2I0B859_9ASPA|nr:hypothetical protein AXF42_Ash004995 [Apostasia shenzhenica]
MEVRLGNAAALHANPGVLSGGLISVCTTPSNESANDSAAYENLIVEEVDSFMEDLNARLIVSRMVTDSVIKGMVNAIEQECAERILSKESELANLSMKLLKCEAYESGKFALDCLERKPEDSVRDVVMQKTSSEFGLCPNNTDTLQFAECFNRLRVAVEHLQKLRDEINPGSEKNLLIQQEGVCSYSLQEKACGKFHSLDGSFDLLEAILAELKMYLGSLVSSMDNSKEQQRQRDSQIESSIIMLTNLIADFLVEYEMKLFDQRANMNSLKLKRQTTFEQLSDLRGELDDISRSLLSWEPGVIFTQNIIEPADEKTAARKRDYIPLKLVVSGHTSDDENASSVTEKAGDYEKPLISDSPQLKCMTKDELICYFRSEMTNMKRQHDVALQEKTEQLFSLKREFLKEKGSSPLHFKKDKEIELIRKRVAVIVSKIDVLLEKEFYNIPGDEDILYGFKEKIDAIFSESQMLEHLLAAKKKEIASVTSKVLMSSNHFTNALVDAQLTSQIDKLQWFMETITFEENVKDYFNKIILSELASGLKSKFERIEMETKISQEICAFLLGEVTKDAISKLYSTVTKCYWEKVSASQNLLVKERALSLEVEENNYLKQKMESLTGLIEIKETLVLELDAALRKQKQQFETMCCEYEILRETASRQELVIERSWEETDMMKTRLEGNIHQIHKYELEIDDINKKFKILSDALEDAEKCKSLLHYELLDTHTKFAAGVTEKNKLRITIESIVSSVSQLLRDIGDRESRVLSIAEHNESRLKLLSDQFDVLSRKASLYRKKLLWYEQAFEKRCEDLQKAETEVDLLGDEVENLLSLLGKIYMALEHYSPVLQHYTGVVEILKLIEREMKGEDGKQPWHASHIS